MHAFLNSQHHERGRYGKKMSRNISFPLIALSFAVVVLYQAFMANVTRRNIARVLMKDESSAYDEKNIPRFQYYNVDLNNTEEKLPLPVDYYPVGKGSVIALLVSGREQDIEEAKIALKSLAFLKGDIDPDHPSPVLIFNEGDITKEDIVAIAKSTNRPISFPRVDFTEFPEGFDPLTEKHSFRVKGRNPWGYYQMIRFWTTVVWKQAAIERFENVMRIDSDSCFKEVNDYLPNFKYDGLYYHSQYVGVEPVHGANYIDGMYQFVEKWMEEKKQPSEPRNALLWHYATSVWKNDKTLPLFRTNFELAKREFMQRGDVARFHEALTEKSPFPVLRQRWGDAVLRFLMLAVFESPNRVLTVRPTGYFHKQGCSRAEVDNALLNLQRAETKVE